MLATISPEVEDVSPRSSSTTRQPLLQQGGEVLDAAAHAVQLRYKHVSVAAVEPSQGLGERRSAHSGPGQPGIGDDLQCPARSGRLGLQRRPLGVEPGTGVDSARSADADIAQRADSSGGATAGCAHQALLR